MGCYIADKGYPVRPKLYERHRISHGGFKRAVNFTEELLMINSEGFFKVLISNYY